LRRPHGAADPVRWQWTCYAHDTETFAREPLSWYEEHAPLLCAGVPAAAVLLASFAAGKTVGGCAAVLAPLLGFFSAIGSSAELTSAIGKP